MPALRPRKPNPVVMCRDCRLCTVLLIKYQATASTMPTITICQKRLRKCGSDQARCMRRAGGGAGLATTDIREAASFRVRCVERVGQCNDCAVCLGAGQGTLAKGR